MSHALTSTLIALTMAATPAAAGDGPLSVTAAVHTALEHNPEVSSALSSADAAAARARQAKGFRLPSLDLTEMYSRTNNPAQVFGLLLNQKRFDMEAFFQSDPNNPAALDTWLTRLELVQPVYTGGKLTARIDQAGLMAEAQRLTHTHTEEKVAFDTITAFVSTAKAREYLGLLQKARDTTAEHVALAEKYAAQGLIIEAEVLKAKVYLARMDELVEQAANGARLAEAALDFQMGIDQTTHHELAPLPPPPPVRGNLAAWTTAAAEQRHDLGAARSKLEAGRLEERLARSGFLPEVALVGRYELYDDSIFGTQGDSGTIMAVAKLNLFRGGSDRAARAVARHQTASFEADINRFEEGIRLQVQQAWQDLKTARARHQTAQASLNAARESLRVREARFRQGLDAMIDLLDAETELREAGVRELTARYDVDLAAYRLYFSSGTSLINVVTSTEETP